MFDQCFLWPDQCSSLPLADPAAEAARLLRLQQFQAAEAQALAVLRAEPDNRLALGLLIMLKLRLVQLPECELLLARLKQLASGCPDYYFLQAQFWLQTGAIAVLVAQSEQFWSDADRFWPLRLARTALFVHLNALPQAAAQLAAIPLPWQGCLEVIRLQCRMLERQQRYQEALELLLPAVQRFPQHWPAQVHLVDLTIKARSQQHALPCLRQALACQGMAPEILHSLINLELLRNRPADARRSALREMAWNGVRPVASVASSNLHNCYDRLGCGEWLPYQPSEERNPDLALSLEMLENRCIQLASQELPITAAVITDVLTHYRAQPQFSACADRLLPPHPGEPLTIAWITADLAYHPVSRFLLGFFSATSQLQHRHLLIDTCDHLGESNRGQFEALTNLEVHNLGSGEWHSKLSSIRDLRADVAIDLSGWTGGQFMRGFLARLAPLQITYLGYFASTGLPSMDVWLGDQHLFPTPMQEWHTEAIHRLKRCFIAWQPPELLPEAHVEIAEARSAGGIRFGSFNHNRKLSDATLRLWGELLASLPGSSLVLKASNRDDAATQELLCRRMRRQGLDPERVIWLPRADGPVEHLRQYGLVDVALDCFPNGGCTTTCEALWMGTPVITLSGRSYVSRMSTAVLHGAAMGEWCAPSPQHYLQLARAQADRLSWLRQNRHHWRHQLQTNPLGDAADLMAQLEGCFSALVAAAR